MILIIADHHWSYMALPHMVSNDTVLKYDTEPNTIDDCVSKCIRLVEIGHACVGINYHRVNLSCQYIAKSFFQILTRSFSHEWDYIIVILLSSEFDICPI